MPSKAEKRKIRQEIRIKADMGKNVKLVERVSPEKSFKPQPQFTTVKIPTEIPALSIASKLMRMSLDRADKSGQWSWGVDRDWGEHTWEGILEPFFCHCLQKTWSEIWSEKFNTKSDTHKKHVFYDIESITDEAIERLIELEFDDQEKIFRFRLGAKKRFYGFVIGDVFAGLWYDPTHKIYPV